MNHTDILIGLVHSLYPRLRRYCLPCGWTKHPKFKKGISSFGPEILAFMIPRLSIIWSFTMATCNMTEYRVAFTTNSGDLGTWTVLQSWIMNERWKGGRQAKGLRISQVEMHKISSSTSVNCKALLARAYDTCSDTQHLHTPRRRFWFRSFVTYDNQIRTARGTWYTPENCFGNACRLPRTEYLP